MVPAPQDEREGVQIVGGPSHDRQILYTKQLQLELLNDRSGDLILHGEHVFHVALIPLRPELVAVLCSVQRTMPEYSDLEELEFHLTKHPYVRKSPTSNSGSRHTRRKHAFAASSARLGATRHCHHGLLGFSLVPLADR